jgi:hypothetical protein
VIRVVLVALMVAGCAHVSVPIPAGLRSCPEAAAAPAAPPRIRDAARLAQFAVDLELAREATRDALVECDRRRGDLVRMIEP